MDRQQGSNNNNPSMNGSHSSVPSANMPTLMQDIQNMSREQLKQLVQELVLNSAKQNNITEYVDGYLDSCNKIIARMDRTEFKALIEEIIALKKRDGRLFLLGVGGSAANASHAVNDFRKICNIQTYAPTDNVSELTARTNDEGWDVVFVNWLIGSRLKPEDAVMVFSVGGGNMEKNVSPNIVKALQYAKEVGARVLGVVSRDGGYTRQVADACVLVPVISDDTITPLAESFQGIIWHGIINYPALRE